MHPPGETPGQQEQGLRQQRFDHMPMNICQATINPVMSDGQPFMVDSQQVQDGRMNVVDLGRVITIQWLVSPLVTGPVRNATLNASSAEPVGKDIGIMVSALAPLG